MRKGAVLFALGFGLVVSGLSAQGSAGLDQYYRFPVGIGVEYRSLSPLASLGGQFTILDVSGFAVLPLSSEPRLQPFLRAGLVNFDSLDAGAPTAWDHRQYYGLLGLAWSSRFTKNFEGGVDLALGASEAVFPSAVPGGPVGAPYLLAEAGLRIGLDPSYSFSVILAPRVRWQKALAPLASMDGFYASVGVSGSFRFGEDPDSARSIIRSLRFEQAKIPSVFPAMKSFYDENALGSVRLVNEDRQPLHDVEVSFYQKGFMDSPTVSASLPLIGARESVEVPVRAVFNRQVFQVEGSQALTGEIIVSYRLRGRPAEQRQSVSYRLEDRRAISWSDDRKVAAFITPQDSALKNYTAYLARVFKEEELPDYGKPLQYAMQIYSGLRELDLLYQEDAASPFTKAQGKAEAVDAVNLARETLKRSYGDCDDLTVLFASLLETRNVETGFIATPGHIFPAVNTKMPAEAFAEVHPDRSMTIPVDGELWVPVEVTLLGRTATFLDAWSKGAELWRTNEASRSFYKTREAQKLFGPVALEERDLGLQYGKAAAAVELLASDLSRHADLVLRSLKAAADKSGQKRDYNRLGIVAAQFARYREAEDALSRAVRLDPKYVSALVNLGNVSYLRKDYEKAIASYRQAQAALLAAGPKAAAAASFAVYVNLARAYTAAGRGDQARQALAQAEKLDPERALALAGAAVGAVTTGRAADAGAEGRVLFVAGTEDEP